MVSDEIKEETQLGQEIARLYNVIKYWDESRYAKDNTREAVSLYYIYYKIDRQIANCKKGIQGSLSFFVAFLGFAALIQSPLFLYAFTIYMYFSFVYLFGYGIYLLRQWWKQPPKAEIRTLYRCEAKTNESKPQNKGIDEIDQLLITLRVDIVDTCNFDVDSMESLQDFVESLEPDKGVKPPGEQYIYGLAKNKSDFAGIEVPVLIVEVIGENNTIEVYPYRNTETEKITINDYLNRISSEME